MNYENIMLVMSCNRALQIQAAERELFHRW